MRVIIYVEGSSDKLVMERLLNNLIVQKAHNGISIEFFETPSGDRKHSVLTKVPFKAVDILRNDASAVVIAMPDLYPKNKAFPHETFSEMEAGIIKNFNDAMRRKGIDDDRIRERFKVFCFKHDLEVLILAAEKQLKQRLGAQKLKRTWVNPVEDQDQDVPPKRIVEDLFREHGSKYVETVDAPFILASADYLDLAEKCPQCFKPFVEFLRGCSV